MWQFSFFLNLFLKIWRFQNSFFFPSWKCGDLVFFFGNFSKCLLNHVCFHGGLFNGFSSQKINNKKKLAALRLCVCLSMWFKETEGLHSVRRSWVPTSLIYKVTCYVHSSVRRRSGSIFYGRTGHKDNWPPTTSDLGPKSQMQQHCKNRRREPRPSVWVLKPRSWEPNAATRQQQKKIVAAPNRICMASKIRFSG
jgi:hypothetical protein